MGSYLLAQGGLSAAFCRKVVGEVHSPHLSAALSVVNTSALRHGKSAALCNAAMKTVEEIRCLRLLQLREEFGSYVKLGERLGMTPRDSTLSQYANGSSGSKTGQPKGMGSTLARRIEAACGKATGWMDSDPDVEKLLWPFGDRVDIGAIASLPPDFLSEAVGALNDVLRRASAAPGKQKGWAA